MTIVTNLLLNLLIILIALLGNQFWIESKPNSRFVKKYSLILTSTIAILLCMAFTFYEQKGIHFDLRRIPFWFGAIYGGTLGTIFITVFTIIIRFFQGGEGAIVSSVNLIFLSAFIVAIRNYYFRQSTNVKVLIATIVNIVFSISVLFSLSEIQGLQLQPETWVEYTVINALGMIIVSYFIELIRKNYLMRKKIIHAEKLEVLSHLAASVNHEIKNPLTTIRGLVQLFKEDCNPQDQNKQELFELALNEINNVENVITEYLTFANPYPNKIEKFQLPCMMKQSISVLNSYAHQKQIQIELNEIPKVSLEGDKHKFIQAIVNILKNCIESMEPAGTIFISGLQTKSLFKLDIYFQGSALNNEKQLIMGEPHFIHNTDGTGLELMVVHRIIKGMKGDIQIYYHSSGTEISLSFPVVS
jgi:two-component system, sporulation sensor kinase B